MPERRRVREFFFLVAVAVVGGLIVAATQGLWSNLFNSRQAGISSSPQTTNGASESPHPSNSPRPTRSVSSPKPTRLAKASLPTPPGVLAPVNQPGFTFQWNDIFTVGLLGIVVRNNGPHLGDGSSYDLLYETTSSWSRGWQAYEIYFAYYRPGSNIPNTPGPLTCYEDDLSGAPLAISHIAHVGDRYCWWMDTTSPERILYIQVTKVEGDNVTLDAWEWSKNS